MLSNTKPILQFVVLLLIAPGNLIAKWCKVSDQELMLFRMTINITYYTALVALFFIIELYRPTSIS